MIKWFAGLAVVLFAAALIWVFVINKETVEPLTNSWEKAIPHQTIPEGLSSLSAESCGVCHQEYYEEWKLSTHAHAWTDLQFQAELQKESSPYLCINCHIPLQNQQEWEVVGLINGDIYRPVKKENPHFDRKLMMEGINCASCHVRDGAIVGTKGNTNAPHKVIKAPELLSENLCIGCHNANAVVTPTLACTFETGDEWKAGPFYGQKNCISCHMPEVERSLVTGYEKRPAHRHFFTGSGIPKFDTVQTTVLNGLSFTKMREEVTKDSVIFQIKVKNEFAGHRVPSGDPERFILTEMALKDDHGKTYAKKTFRIGEKWEWYPLAKKLSDNNLYPGEERIYSFKSKLPGKGNYTLITEVTKHRLDKENAAYNKLGSNYPLFIKIWDNEYQFVIKN